MVDGRLRGPRAGTQAIRADRAWLGIRETQEETTLTTKDTRFLGSRNRLDLPGIQTSNR